MRPPICAICRARFSPNRSGGGGTTVSFTLTEEEAASKKRMIELRRVGHPPGLEWFCENHIDQAKELKHLSRGEALSILRSKDDTKSPEISITSYKKGLLRLATLDDRKKIESLVALSTRALSKDDYSDEQIEGALTHAMGLDTQLIEDKTYYVIEQDAELIACGGWSYRGTLFGNDQEESRDPAVIDPETGWVKIRAFFVHPEHARQGHGKNILDACEKAAREANYWRFELMATLPGVKLYEKFGYRAKDPILYPLGDNLTIEFVPMWKKRPRNW